MNDAEDPYLWLEEVESDRALDWVRARNEHALTILKTDSRYVVFRDQALAILNARDKLPWVGFAGEERLANFWQDETKIRGVWRETTLDSYRTDTPEWQTILDLDDLATTENANWVYKGNTSLLPSMQKTLVFLSDGGKDATTAREFDRDKKQFPVDGFVSPRASSRSAGLIRTRC